ncbi:hypothetical protein REPUB_Repub17cG0103700 [Reevesia pubescens]
MKRTKDQPDKPRVMTNNVKEGSMPTYKRKRKSVVADPPKLLSGKQICSKLHSYASAEALDGKLSEQLQTSPQKAAIARFLKSDAWNCPKGKRTHRKVPIHSGGESNMHASFTSVGAEEHNLHSLRKNNSDESLSSRNFNEKVTGIVTKSDSAVSSIRISASHLDRAKAVQTGMLNCLDSTSIINGLKNLIFGQSLRKSIGPCAIECNTTLSCTKAVNEASLNNRPYVYHRRPCNKNLPKPSLLKDLMRLDEFVRTRNMLEAIALGKPVVAHLWLDSRGQASCLLDEKNNILRDSKREKEIGFSMAVPLARARQCPLLKVIVLGYEIHFKPDIILFGCYQLVPETSTILEYLERLPEKSSSVVETSQKLEATYKKIPDDLLILSCEPLLENGEAVYSSELLLNGIVIQKLEHERHQLFAQFVKEKRKISEEQKQQKEKVKQTLISILL